MESELCECMYLFSIFFVLTVSVDTSFILVGGASPPHVSHDCSVTSEDESCDLPLEPPPISEPVYTKDCIILHYCANGNIKKKPKSLKKIYILQPE